MPFLNRQNGSDIPRHLKKKGATNEYLAQFFKMSKEELDKTIEQDRSLSKDEVLILEKLLKSSWIDGKLKYPEAFGRSKKERWKLLGKARTDVKNGDKKAAVEKAKDIVAREENKTTKRKAKQKVSFIKTPAAQPPSVKRDLEIYYEYSVQEGPEGLHINLTHVIPPHDKTLTLSGSLTILPK